VSDVLWHNRKQMRQYINTKRADMFNENTGVEGQMQVVLREVDPFSLWVRP